MGAVLIINKKCPIHIFSYKVIYFVSLTWNKHKHLSFQDQMPSDLEIQLEVERIVVQEFAQEMYSQLSLPDVLSVHNDSAAMSTTSSKGRRKKTPKPRYDCVSIFNQSPLINMVRPLFRTISLHAVF